MKNVIVLSIVFVAILITALIVYPTKTVSPYRITGRASALDSITNFFKKLFSRPKPAEPEYQRIAKEFIDTYLKPEFWPDSIDLTYGFTPFVKGDRTFYGYAWTVNRDEFYTKVQYNEDKKTISHLFFVITNLRKNETASHYLNIPAVDRECRAKHAFQNSCIAKWYEGGDRIDLMVNYVNGKTVSILLCRVYKESEVYEALCGTIIM